MRLNSWPVCAVLSLFLWQGSSCHTTKPITSNSPPANQSTKAMKTPIKGSWGGTDIALEVTAEGVDITFSCAHGHIDDAIAADSHGSFSVKGTYVREHGGPIRSDETVNARSATYKGNITGEKMTLTVTFADGTEDIGPFNLEHGKEARLHRCM